jgi:cation transport ATPase
MAPAGLALSTLAVVLEATPDRERWGLLGCAVAAIILSLRNALHAWANRSVEAVGLDLARTLPARTRIPTEDGIAYEEVPADWLRAGDLAVVLEGERLPVDGVVEEGDGIALLYPRAPRAATVNAGDFLLAGTQVTEGAITVRARRARRDLSLARALHLDASTSSRVTRARNLLARWGWIPIAAAALAFAATTNLAAAGALLLGLPAVALLAALDAPLDSAARASALRGMFFGSGAALLDAGRVGTTAVLLRGALTAGEPIVQQVQALGKAKIDDVLALAAAAERVAPNHPIARAILRYADERPLPAVTVRRERLHAGLGVTAVGSGGGSVVVGRRQLLLNEGISVATADDEAKHIENEGLTPVFVAVDGNLEALLAIHDPTHVGAPDAVRRMAELPSEVVILSGDDRRTVERIAEQLGASRVKAPLLPEERALEVRALRETGGVTAAIGRGGEDDAVLAEADVPVSLRLAGTATEERGVVAAGRDIRDAAGALWIARAARRSIARSLAAGLAMLIPVGAGAWLGFLTPPLAAAIGIGLEVWSLRAGSRLLRRVDLRVPTRQ